MSVRGEDWSPASDPSDPGEGDRLGRPASYRELARLDARTGKVIEMSDHQVELALGLLSVPYRNLPQPPFFAPLVGFTADKHKRLLARHLADSAAAMHRLPTVTEADTVAYHASKYISRETWARPSAFATALVFTLRGHSTFRFPFYTPQPPWFHPSAFPSAARRVLTGRSAMLLWHSLRFGAYAIICDIVVGGFIGSFASTSYVLSLLGDDRLKAMRESISAQAKEKLGRVPSRPRNTDTASSDDVTPFQQSPPYQEPPPSRPAQQQQQQQPSQWSQRAPEPQESARDDDSFLFDDASPVSTAQRQQPHRHSAGSTASPTGGSTWDRIRQRAKAEENTWNTAGQQDGESRAQPRTEQYTISPSEQERAFAREQAQKEFDAMLERERRGVGESGGRN